MRRSSWTPITAPPPSGVGRHVSATHLSPLVAPPSSQGAAPEEKKREHTQQVLCSLFRVVTKLSTGPTTDPAQTRHRDPSRFRLPAPRRRSKHIQRELSADSGDRAPAAACLCVQAGIGRAAGETGQIRDLAGHRLVCRCLGAGFIYTADMQTLISGYARSLAATPPSQKRSWNCVRRTAWPSAPAASVRQPAPEDAQSSPTALNA